MLVDDFGYLGVFLGGAIPWLEAITVVPAGIIFGLNPFLTVLFALLGNIATIALFAFFGAKIRSWAVGRSKGSGRSNKRMQKAQAAFDKYGIYVLALLGPVIVGTQFAAAASVAAGVRPLRTTLIISLGTAIWAVVFALATTLLRDQILQL
jgi:Ca2+/H+ antiporter, TMEM165/GDT1 family